MRNKINKKQALGILRLRRKGAKNGEIARQFGITIQAVHYWIRKLREAGHAIEKRKTGRPKIEI